MSDPELSVGRAKERGREEEGEEGCNHRNSEVSQAFLFPFSISEHTVGLTHSYACMDTQGKGKQKEGKKRKGR